MINQSINQTKQATSKPTNQVAKSPRDQSIRLPTNKPSKESTNQTKQATSKLTNQQANQVAKVAKKSINPPTNEQTKQGII